MGIFQQILKLIMCNRSWERGFASLLLHRRYGKCLKKQILLAGNKPWQPVQVASDDQTSASTPLNISLAHRWMKLFETGQVKSVVDLADLLDRDISKLRKILKLADLDPLEVEKVMGNGVNLYE